MTTLFEKAFTNVVASAICWHT